MLDIDVLFCSSLCAPPYIPNKRISILEGPMIHPPLCKERVGGKALWSRERLNTGRLGPPFKRRWITPSRTPVGVCMMTMFVDTQSGISSESVGLIETQFFTHSVLHYPIGFISGSHLTACFKSCSSTSPFFPAGRGYPPPHRQIGDVELQVAPTKGSRRLFSIRGPLPLFSGLGPVAYGRCQIIGHGKA